MGEWLRPGVEQLPVQPARVYVSSAALSSRPVAGLLECLCGGVLQLAALVTWLPIPEVLLL